METLRQKIEYYFHFSFRGFFELCVLVGAVCLADPSPESFWAGTSLALCGSAIRFWVSGFPRPTKLNSVFGPYLFVRHPLYLGNFLLLFGFALAGRNELVLGFFLLGTALIYRSEMRKEDQAFRAHLGAKIDLYLRDVSALVPQLMPYRGPVAESLGFSFKRARQRSGGREIDNFVGLIVGVVGIYLLMNFARADIIRLSLGISFGLFLIFRMIYYRNKRILKSGEL